MTQFGDVASEAAIAKPQTFDVDLYASARCNESPAGADIKLLNKQNIV